MADPELSFRTRFSDHVAEDCGVVVVACIRDEEAYLDAAVASVLAQDHAGDVRLVLAVGPSHDATEGIADRLAAQHDRVTVVPNPTGSRSVGLNLAIDRAAAAEETAEHPILVRVDGHTVLPRGYVRQCVELLQRTGAVGVGGVMSPVGDGPVQQAAARAMSHPAGIGAASFHTGGLPGTAETVYLGAFLRDAVRAVGGYDPTLFRAEDWELCLRLRRAGGMLWFDPSLVVEYRPRRTLRAVAKQFWRTGMWRREVVRRDRSTASLRYLAPPVLALALGVAAVAGVAGLVAHVPALVVGAALVPASYLCGVLVACCHAARRRPRLGVRPALLLPVVFVLMHVCWGVGFLRGLTARAAADHRA